jgi:hypothetical protein
MSEETKIELTPVPEKPDTFKDASGNVYLKEELATRIISQRVGEQVSKKTGDADARAQAAEEAKQAAETALAEAKTQLKTLEAASATVDQSNAVLKETFDAICAGMSDDAKALVPEHGTLAERIKYINKNAVVFFPKGSGDVQVSKPNVQHKDPPASNNQNTQSDVQTKSQEAFAKAMGH